MNMLERKLSMCFPIERMHGETIGRKRKRFAVVVGGEVPRRPAETVGEVRGRDSRPFEKRGAQVARHIRYSRRSSPCLRPSGIRLPGTPGDPELPKWAPLSRRLQPGFVILLLPERDCPSTLFVSISLLLLLLLLLRLQLLGLFKQRRGWREIMRKRGIVGSGSHRARVPWQ